MSMRADKQTSVKIKEKLLNLHNLWTKYATELCVCVLKWEIT